MRAVTDVRERTRPAHRAYAHTYKRPAYTVHTPHSKPQCICPPPRTHDLRCSPKIPAEFLWKTRLWWRVDGTRFSCVSGVLRFGCFFAFFAFFPCFFRVFCGKNIENGKFMKNRKPFVHFHIQHFTGTSLFCDVRPYVNKAHGTVTIDKYTFHLKDVKSVQFNRNRKTVYVSLVNSGETSNPAESLDVFTKRTMDELFGSI